MPNFYIISDVHGFYNEMRTALDEAGFDPNDENSWLISLGDEMDRGPEPEGVINYIMSLPRAIWIKGNHQTLMEDLISRNYPLQHDWHNGTMQSIMSLAPNAKTQSETFAIAYEKTKSFFDKAIDYLELKEHILVHSFIPLKSLDNLPKYYTRKRKFEFDPDWRHAHASEWEEARWGNPLKLAIKGLNQTEKTIVSGHWHCSAGWAMEAGIPEFGYGACFEPYYYEDKLIMIDTATAHTKKVNVLVLEDEFLEEGDSTNDSSAAS